MIRQELGDAVAERGADGAECAVNAASESLHAGGGAKGDQGHDQSILDQILTFLAVDQILELHIHLDEQVVHLLSSLKIGIPSHRPGRT